MPTHPLLAMARINGNPIIESDSVTYLWQGRTAPRLIDDLHNWEDDPQTMSRTGSDLWSFSYPLASNAYIEYAFLDPKTSARFPDPFNPNRVWNGINAYNNYFYMPGGGPTELIRPAEGIHPGTVTRHIVPTKELVVGKTREVHLYRPPVKTPVPLLVVFDGTDYLKRGRLNVIVDHLIASKRVRPFAMAMVQNGGAARGVEYTCSEATLDFLFDCVIPLAQEHLTLTPPGGEPYGVMGASLGGLMALFTGLRLSKIFGKVLSQSGCSILPDHQFVTVDLVRYTPPPDIEIWMDVGKYEGLLEGNRQMVALLKEKKFNVKYYEYPGAHNYTSWRNDVWRGLEVLFK